MKPLYTKEGTQVLLTEVCLGEGKEGRIYSIATPSIYSDYCAKIFSKSARTTETEAKIDYMICHQLPVMSGRLNRSFRFAWPIASLYTSEREFVGYVMPKAFDGSISLKYLQTSNMNKKLDREWFDKFDYESNQDRIGNILSNRVKLVRNISYAIGFIHDAGNYVLGDIKPDNIMVTKNGSVTLLDLNAMQIVDGDRMFQCTTHTPEYIPPEFFNQGVGRTFDYPLDTSWDAFSAAVVMYRLLFVVHPYSKLKSKSRKDIETIDDSVRYNLFPFGEMSNDILSSDSSHERFKMLDSHTQDLFKKAFCIDEKYKNRPLMGHWYPQLKNCEINENAIEEAKKKAEDEDIKKAADEAAKKAADEAAKKAADEAAKKAADEAAKKAADEAAKKAADEAAKKAADEAAKKAADEAAKKAADEAAKKAADEAAKKDADEAAKKDEPSWGIKVFFIVSLFLELVILATQCHLFLAVIPFVFFLVLINKKSLLLSISSSMILLLLILIIALVK